VKDTGHFVRKPGYFNSPPLEAIRERERSQVGNRLMYSGVHEDYHLDDEIMKDMRRYLKQ
jgi:hypothetical protein